MKTVLCEGKEVSPLKVICVGRNYVEHIHELDNAIPDEPVIFLKPNSAISSVIKTHPIDAIHYEAEICFLIKNNKIQAVGFGLDLTKREIQTQLKNQGLPWERAKAFDHSAVFSDFKNITANTDDLRLELYINDALIQQGDVKLMLFKPNTILDNIIQFLTIDDHDVIMTGTPKGVGLVNSGDVFVGRILENNALLVEAKWFVN